MLNTEYHPNKGHLHVTVVKASELDIEEKREKKLDGKLMHRHQYWIAQVTSVLVTGN